MIELVFAAYMALAAPDLRLELGRSLTASGQYEESEAVLEPYSPADIKSRQLYHFLRLTNNFAANRRKEAALHAQLVGDGWSNTLPERYEILTEMMIESLGRWKDNDLADIGRDMKNVGHRLDQAKSGKQTQAAQDAIVKKLDKLIKDQEDAKNNPSDGKGAAAQAGQKDGPGTGNPTRPASDSQVGGIGGPGQVDEKKLKAYAAEWGRLPPSERANALREITRDVPAKFKPQIEEYFRSLNRITPTAP